ncbi:hypothetical protein ALCH109712_11530 [Alkalicoccus chagannorensis]
MEWLFLIIPLALTAVVLQSRNMAAEAELENKHRST